MHVKVIISTSTQAKAYKHGDAWKVEHLVLKQTNEFVVLHMAKFSQQDSKMVCREHAAEHEPFIGQGNAQAEADRKWEM